MLEPGKHIIVTENSNFLQTHRRLEIIAFLVVREVRFLPNTEIIEHLEAEQIIEVDKYMAGEEYLSVIREFKHPQFTAIRYDYGFHEPYN